MSQAAAWLLLALLAGCATVPSGEVPAGGAVLYVVERGWHTDIGLPVTEVGGPLASLEQDFPGVRFMVFGFGEREFYMSRTAGSGEMLAALLPSKSAILMTALLVAPDEAFAGHRVAVLRLPQSGVDTVAGLIWDELEKTPEGAAVRLAPGPYPGSLFYASRETYDAFNTCNTWTASLLHAGGLPVNHAGVLLAGQVMEQALSVAARQAARR